MEWGSCRCRMKVGLGSTVGGLKPFNLETARLEFLVWVAPVERGRADCLPELGTRVSG